MADPVILPSTSYRPPSPSQARMAGRKLNTIMEEDHEDAQHQHQLQQRIKPKPMALVNGDHSTKHLHPSTSAQIDAWFSPMSDHFPTPRGVHFLAAPIVPSSPSDYSTEDPPTSPNSSNNRTSVMTDVTEFEDLYGVSDDEDKPKRVPSRKASIRRKSMATAPDEAPCRALPALDIPSAVDNTSMDDASARSATRKNKVVSPVPPTTPAHVEMSSDAISLMQARQSQDIPTISAPPSLDGSMDGSLSSEQLAQLSAPPTPVIDNDDNDKGSDGWSGVVQLQPGALATLQALSGDSSSVGEEHEHPQPVIELPQEPAREMRQQGLRIFTDVRVQFPGPAETTPASQTPQRHSLADLTKLEIPSPGGFFSGLSPRTRSTWHMNGKTPDDAAPPTSTTAEQFYRCPWNIEAAAPSLPSILDAFPTAQPANGSGTFEEPVDHAAEHFYRGAHSTSSAPVEQVIQVDDEAEFEDDVPTARPVLPLSEPASTEPQHAEEAPIEIVTGYDPQYARKQQEIALNNLDRTEMWLMAQKAYLKPVDAEDAKDANELATIPEDQEEEEAQEHAQARTPETKGKDIETSSPPSRKKMVRFSLEVTTATTSTTNKVPRSLPSKLRKQESAYYRAFQDYVVRAGRLDVFTHRVPRFEALQAQRISRREFHRNQLLGKYQLSVMPQSAKKRLSANVARGDDVLQDDPEKLKSEKEHEAMSQMATPAWHVAAMKLLNGGRLITAPVAKRLNRVSRMAPGPDGVARDRVRILDLGGQSTCDWAWHCALQYPNIKVYTVTTKAIRQLSNSNIRGPPNHRQVAIEKLTKLPFADAQFDLVSARELHSVLKFVGENGEDEWEGCLRECMRVLKPGGYLDFSLLDSDIVNAGPLGLAKSVEFGFSLKTLGYDACPTKMWLGRLARAGFDDVRRAWVCLPVGEQRRPTPQDKPLPALPTPKPSPNGQDPPRTVTLDAMVTGSTDAAATVTGLVGGWSWERWVLRCEMEKVAGELRLADTVTAGSAMREAGKCLEGVAGIIEEGRGCGAAWRMLNGYARKPKVSTACETATRSVPMKVAV